jgi:hypothetical protein
VIMATEYHGCLEVYLCRRVRAAGFSRGV